jgi:F-type H+-transporting ATPase subunit a
MSSDILHIKDGYFFEVPRALWRSNREKASDFPSWFVRLDEDFQSKEADAIIEGLKGLGVDPVELASLKDSWHDWQHQSTANAGWPLDAYLEKQSSDIQTQAAQWAGRNAPDAKDAYGAYAGSTTTPAIDWFVQIQRSPEKLAKWKEIVGKVDQKDYLQNYLTDAKWDAEKLKQYNSSLDGKIMIPQPFGEPKNAYESGTGFCISRYMLIELAVAVIALFVFRWLAGKVSTGESPKGKRWNMLEGLVQWVRNDVAVPAMGEHDADRFMPFLWTLFVFILGCNLMGMLPWVGSPTAAFGTTLALAGIVFIIGVAMGVKTFGPVGFLKNICPDLGLPWYLAFWIVPLLWVIEFASLIIKHAVLAVRLLMNMGAGHLVMLGILGIGISVPAAMMSTPAWTGVAMISVIGTALLSVLELFVAFLQAYLFTFLAAMFIGSSMHHH